MSRPRDVAAVVETVHTLALPALNLEPLAGHKTWLRLLPQSLIRLGTASLLTALSLGTPAPAYGFDGCKVLLCFGGAWRSIPDCFPDVPDALKCMARGKCWPTCASAPGLSMSWANTPSCPPQYGIYETDACGRQTLVGCTKTGVLNVAWNGDPSWTRVWFNQGAADNSVVLEYSDAAKLVFGAYIDPQFDLDYAAWVATQPTTPPPLCVDGGN
jgi:hypothetical protein